MPCGNVCHASPRRPPLPFSAVSLIQTRHGNRVRHPRGAVNYRRFVKGSKFSYLIRSSCLLLCLSVDEYKMKAVEEVKYMRGEEDRVNTRNQENLSQQEFFRMLDEKIEKGRDYCSEEEDEISSTCARISAINASSSLFLTLCTRSSCFL
ncbi:hypothetical protein JZ751_013613 [Albula glossodonta]|uniref:Uncharacterized protein n=1 Tax=Albula glossodonta TaxID=121402 RepID=A0A8T2NTB1_9TELE|nr:hypothetical protein JZ751_013613 [Albula glossodonta]